MQTPLVSIIIPTYNRAHLIGETLDSVLAQTYTNWECIVVDDGSTDNTDSLLANYCAKDNRFQYHHRPSDRPKGANACRNYGFELSKGEYVNWLDSDDLLSNNKIEAQIKGLINSSGDIATCKWGRFDDKTDFMIKELPIYKDYINGQKLLVDYGLKKSFFPPHIFLLKSKLISKSGLWNESLKINQDGEFFCRVLVNSMKVTFCDKGYALYRLSTSENTSKVLSSEKAEHLILSWNLIESYLRVVNPNRFKEYINVGRSYSYELLKLNYKKMLNENKRIFKKQIKKDSLLNRAKRLVINKKNN